MKKSKKLILIFSTLAIIPLASLSLKISEPKFTKYFDFPEQWKEEKDIISKISLPISGYNKDKLNITKENVKRFNWELIDLYNDAYKQYSAASYKFTCSDFSEFYESIKYWIKFEFPIHEFYSYIEELVSELNIEKNKIYEINTYIEAIGAEYKTDGRIIWDIKNTNLSSFNVVIKTKNHYVHNNKKYLNSWYKWKNEILHQTTSFTIPTDTGDTLDYFEKDPNKINSVKSNKQYLDEYIDNLNKNVNINDLKLRYQQTSPDTIDLYLTTDTINQILAQNIKINFKQTPKFETLNMLDRLKISLGKWVDFNTKTTQLVDDVLLKDPSDTKPIKLEGEKRYGGRWIAHTPLKITFNALKSETEVLKINGKRIDVLDRFFEETLQDNRKDATDNDQEFDSNIEITENLQKTDENSHKKNEYKIEIIKYKNPGNLDSDIEYTYTKTLIIDSRSSQMNFKWYAWDPKNNPNQHLLIDEFLKDENGKNKQDENGNPIKNPKYDPAIDKETGTKKQLIWFSFNNFYSSDSQFEDNNGQIEKKSGFDKYYSDQNDKEYYKNTKLPYHTKTIFAPHKSVRDLDRGTIMEASVLGKGALKQLIGQNENFVLFKLSEQGYFQKVDSDYYKKLVTQTSESSYFSESGIWMFASNTKNAISNFKLILIKEDSSPHSYFTDNIQKCDWIIPLWKTEQGKKFYHYLIKSGISSNEIANLNYEDAMEHYKTYINNLYWGNKYKSNVNIIPKFKGHLNDEYTSDEFKNKYFTNLIKFEEDYLDDFENKTLVKISKIEFNSEKTGIYIYFKLVTNEIIYSLPNEKIFVSWKFKDINTSSNVINLFLNQNYLLDLAQNSLKEEFLSKINRQKLFNISEAEFSKIKIWLEFMPLTNELIIKVNLLDKFKNIYKLEPQSIFKINIGNFKKNNSLEESIFKNIKKELINLHGINSINEAKTYVITKVKQMLPNLELEKDYIIKNLEQVINERIWPQTDISEINHATKSILILEAINSKVGYEKIEVINIVNQILENEYDLNTKKLNDSEINENRLSLLKKKVIEIINNQFLKENFILNKDIKINNFFEGIMLLAQGKGIEFQFIISGLNSKIKNETSINIKNLAKFVVDDEDPNYKPGDENNPDKAILYNLSNIQLDLFNFSEHIMSELRNKILSEIKIAIYKKYYINLNEHYTINFDELNTLVKKIAQKSNELLEGELKIYSVKNKSINSSTIKIANFNKLFDPINDLDKPIFPIDTPEEQAAKKKKIMLIFIPLGCIGLIAIGLLIWFIYLRKIRNKVS